MGTTNKAITKTTFADTKAEKNMNEQTDGLTNDKTDRFPITIYHPLVNLRQ